MSILRLFKSLLADCNVRMGELLTDRNTLIELAWSNARLLEDRFPGLATAQRALIQQILDRDDKYLQQLERQAAQDAVTSSGELH